MRPRAILGALVAAIAAGPWGSREAARRRRQLERLEAKRARVALRGWGDALEQLLDDPVVELVVGVVATVAATEEVPKGSRIGARSLESDRAECRGASEEGTGPKVRRPDRCARIDHDESGNAGPAEREEQELAPELRSSGSGDRGGTASPLTAGTENGSPM